MGLISRAVRETVYQRDRLICVYCGRLCRDVRPKPGRRHPKDGATVDHVVPKSQGGNNSPANLVTACWTCNHLKGDKTVFAPRGKHPTSPAYPDWMADLDASARRARELARQIVQSEKLSK